MNYIYHGSYKEIKKPDLKIGRIATDFGQGFYLSQDIDNAKKWACKSEKSFLNTYTLFLDNLSVKEISLDNEWLEIVHTFRNGEIYEFDKNYDVIIGPIADDKLFATFELYELGVLSDKQTIEVMNCMNYGTQYVLKTENAVNNLNFVKCKELKGAERALFKQLLQDDIKMASQKTKEMIQKIQRGG